MTLFEYLAIAFSIGLSFASGRLIQGLPHAVRKESRYWVHLCFVTWQLIVCVVAFWIMWSYRDVAWTLPSFGLVLVGLGMIYYNACSIIPESPSSVRSWREHYYGFRRRYFVGVAAWMITAALTSTVMLDMPALHPARIGHAGVLVTGVVGAYSPSPRVHAVLAIVVLILSALMVVGVGFQPGAFATG